MIRFEVPNGYRRINDFSVGCCVVVAKCLIDKSVENGRQANNNRCSG